MLSYPHVLYWLIVIGIGVDSLMAAFLLAAIGIVVMAFEKGTIRWMTPRSPKP